VIAVEMNVSAMNLAKLAQTKTKDPNVKAFADAMIKSHTQQLTKLRKNPGAPLSEVPASAPHEAAAEKLSKLSGAEFDREFANQAVANYQQQVNFLEIQSKETDNAFAKAARELKSRAMDDLLRAENLRQTLATGNTATSRGNVFSEPGTAPAPASPPAPASAAPSTNGGGPIP